MVKPKEQGSELFFVEVRDPGEVRRNILETLKEILATMQRFEKFKQMRHQKLDNIHKLRALLRQANRMIGDLKSKLPQTDLKAVVIREQKPQAEKAWKQNAQNSKQKPQEKPKKKELTELERLESELSAIEGKLKNL